MESAPLLQIMIDAVITTNALSIDAQQLVALILQLCVTMEMHAHQINATQDLDYAFTLHKLARALIFAQLQPAMHQKE
jgi:hypothetical protein